MTDKTGLVSTMLVSKSKKANIHEKVLDKTEQVEQHIEHIASGLLLCFVFVFKGHFNYRYVFKECLSSQT